MLMRTAPASLELLRVAHIVLSLDVGGLERNVVNQVREGQRLGQHVSVICLERCGALADRVQALGAEVVSLDKPPGLRPSMVARMRSALGRLHPHVIHTHQITTLLYAGAAAKLVGVPVIVHTEHGKERYATRLRTRLLGRIAASMCDRFYCLTADMAAEVQNWRIADSRKVRVIQNGIDVGQFTSCPVDSAEVRRSLGIPPDAPLIGTVGRLSEVKRQDVLIRTFAKVRTLIPTAHLLLVGDGPLLGELQWLAADLNVAAFVHFAGYQPHSGPSLNAMDVFVLTSRSEGMPQSALEASVVGLPVVATRVGGLSELIEDGVTGVLFPPGNEAELARILVSLLHDPERCKGMGAAARTLVEAKFDVARMARDYHRDVTALLRERRRTRDAAEPMPSLASKLS